VETQNKKNIVFSIPEARRLLSLAQPEKWKLFGKMLKLNVYGGILVWRDCNFKKRRFYFQFYECVFVSDNVFRVSKLLPSVVKKTTCDLDLLEDQIN
jgi:hypothetical protein